MKHVRGVVLLFLCALATHAHALDPSKPIVYGVGVESCGKWLTSDNDPAGRLMGVNWVLGWLSAAGYYEDHGNLRETDADAITAWVDKYCRDTPLNNISNAAAALVEALARKTSKQL